MYDKRKIFRTRVPLDVTKASKFFDGNGDFFNVIGHRTFRCICSVLFRARATRPRRDRENYQVIAIGYFNQFESSFPKLDQLSLDSAEFRLCAALSRRETKDAISVYVRTRLCLTRRRR